MTETVPAFAEVLEAVVEVLQVEGGVTAEVPADAELRALAIDSLAALTVVVALEDRFRVTLPEDAASEVRTVSDLASLVIREARARSVA